MPARNEEASARQNSEDLFAEYARTHDTVIRDELIAAHANLVRYLAGKFANRGEPLEDLVSVGNIGLIKAVDRFDPNRGIQFSTFATPTIVGEIRRHFRDKGWSLKVPRRFQELNLAAAKASGELTRKLGRTPNLSEIAEYIGATEEATLSALELANAYSTLSIDAPHGGSGDNEGMAARDTLGAEDESLIKLELYGDLDRAMECLGERERGVLYFRFFREMSQAEVARQLNISQMHVSRLQQKALKRLRKMLTE